MSEPTNPYESPTQPAKSTTHRAVKAGISSLTILVLMPLAMFVAFCIGCGISMASIDTLFGQNYNAMLLFTIVLSWGSPIAVMAAMLVWRSRVRHREIAEARRMELQEESQT